MCTLESLTLTRYGGSRMSEPKEHVNVQKLHTHPGVGGSHGLTSKRIVKVTGPPVRAQHPGRSTLQWDLL